MLKVKMQIPVWVRLTDDKYGVQYRILTRGYPITIQGVKCASHLSTNPAHKDKDLWRVTELSTGNMVGSTKTGRKATESHARSTARAMERKLDKSLSELTTDAFKRLPNLMELPPSRMEATLNELSYREAKEVGKLEQEKKRIAKAKKLLSAPSKAKKSRGLPRQKETG